MDLIPQCGSDFCNQSIFNLVVDFWEKRKKEYYHKEVMIPSG